MSQIDADQKNTTAVINELAAAMGRPLTDIEKLSVTAAMYQDQRDDLLAVAEKADELVQMFVGTNSPDEPYLIYSLPREVQDLVYELMEMSNNAVAAAKGEK